MTAMTPKTLFVRALTAVDASVWSNTRGLYGISQHLDLELDGAVGHDGMLFDFGDVKPWAKRMIDQDADHTLIVPSQAEGVSITDCPEGLCLRFTQPYAMEVRGPRQAFCLLPVTEVTTEVLANHFEKLLTRRLPPRVEALRVRLRDETIDGAAYTYSHGLRHHSGNCQRIAHGHRSPLIIERNGVRDTALEAEWAEKLNDRYLAEEGDLIDRPGRELVFSYEAPQGRFRIRLPRKQVWLLPTPTTIEWIADWLARQIALDSGDSIRVEAYEGINKGAIARHTPQTAREPLVLPEHEDTSATS
jgi:6-pyruvoyl-tetrahydropterin synthase